MIMAIKIGINGFGRIGRVILRTCLDCTDIDVTAINDPAIDVEYICYLIKYDSTHGTFNGSISHTNDVVFVNGKSIKVFHQKYPSSIPWQLADVQYVIEASGMFTSYEKAVGHIRNETVKQVIVTASSPDLPIVILGVNEEALNTDVRIISNASSTLYCLAPIVKVLQDNFGIEDGFITSIHAMTPSLKPLDGLCVRGKHWRDHRSIHQNIIPASTGACRILNRIMPQMKDKLAGIAFRVPIVNVSVLDLTVRLNTNTNLREIMRAVEHAGSHHMNNIIKISNAATVSSDYMGDSYSCIVDAESSLQLRPNFYKLVCWYENEYSYACRVRDVLRHYSNIKHKPVSNLRAMSTARLSKKDQIAEDAKNKQVNEKLRSVSQDTGLKKIVPQLPLRKPQSVNLPTNNTTNKEMEIFKIWNEELPVCKPETNSFYHECLAKIVKNKDDTKTQEKLERIKKDFSMMLNITEHLLKKSYLKKTDMGNQGDSIHTNVLNSTSDVASTEIKNNILLQNVKHKNTEKNNLTNPNVSSYTMKSSAYSFAQDLSDYNLCDKKFDLNNTFPCNTYSEGVSDVTQSRSDLTLDGAKTNNTNVVYSNNPIIALQATAANNNTFGKYSKLNCFIPNDKLVTTNTKTIPWVQPHKYFGDQTNINKNYKQRVESYLKAKNIEPNTPAAVATRNSDSAKLEIQKDALQNKFLEKIDQTQLRYLKLLMKKNINKSKTSTNDSKEDIHIQPGDVCSYKHGLKPDMDSLYDKLESVSVTDSENSFHVYEKKSQVIDIDDLTKSLHDLACLDKICKIIEISDELSNKLFGVLEDDKGVLNNNWSFAELCDKLKLDDFCENLFGKTRY